MLRCHAFAIAALTLCTAIGFSAQQAPRPTPREALGQLKAGNDRFARNTSKPVSLSVNRRKELAGAQSPSAMILSCADSRLPPELVFNAGLGELFVIRSAAGVVDRAVLATIEYGADRLHIPLLVVMGHESCDVVTAAAGAKGAAESANLDYLYKAIQAATHETAEDRDEVRSLVLGNVEQVINDTLVKSPLPQAGHTRQGYFTGLGSGPDRTLLSAAADPRRAGLIRAARADGDGPDHQARG